MANTLPQKLRISENMKLLTLHAPDDFVTQLGSLPPGVQVIQKGNDYQQIHWFVKNKAAVEAEMGQVIALLKDDVVCWIYYPKGSSSIQTDLTRDRGWDKLLAHDELKWISLISFDSTWSVFGMRRKTPADTNKEAAAKPRAILDYIDATARTISLPPDLQAALQINEPAALFFDALSFTNKKEYVEWIVTAKREETRQQRISGTIERLEKRWKNPRNT